MDEIPMIPKSFKPVDVVDNFGDSTLSCGNCKKPLYFEFSKHNRRPSHCKMCGCEIDWSKDNQMKEGEK